MLLSDGVGGALLAAEKLGRIRGTLRWLIPALLATLGTFWTWPATPKGIAYSTMSTLASQQACWSAIGAAVES
eukprot:2925770-Pyramimonas_sp.AAC.1